MIHTRKILPTWLSYTIFKDWGAVYNPDFEKFQRNLLSGEGEIKVYLGTYFPRSYAESYCIFSNLFSNTNYRTMIEGRDTFNLLTIGCGTGGDVIGFIDAVHDNLPQIKNINVEAVDGNYSAIDKLYAISRMPYYQHSFEHLEVNPSPIPFNSANDINILCSVLCKQFDFISSFKFINELISDHILGNDAYGKLTNALSCKLSDIGILIFEDVTRQMQDGAWLPCLMNVSMREFTNSNDEYKTLVPIPCHYYENGCNNNCYTQLVFNDGKSNSKVCYRMISRSAFAQRMVPITAIHEGYYKLNPRNQYCIRLNGGNSIYSPYDLSI